MACLAHTLERSSLVSWTQEDTLGFGRSQMTIGSCYSAGFEGFFLQIQGTLKSGFQPYPLLQDGWVFKYLQSFVGVFVWQIWGEDGLEQRFPL